MKFLLKTHSKKFITFILSAMIVLSTLTVGLAVATSVEKVVVDAAGTLTDGASAPDGSIIKKFTTIRQAIDYLNGDEGTIYINGTYSTSDHESISGTDHKTKSYGQVTITGYNGTADTFDISRSYNHIVQGGVIKFENITYATPTDDTNSLSTNYMQKGLWSRNGIIFGENVVMTGKGLRLGGGYGYEWDPDDNHVVVYSGTFNYVYPAANPNQNTMRLERNVTYEFHGGTIKNFYGGYISNSSGTPYIAGDYIVTVDGTTSITGGMHLGSRNTCHGYVAGNTVYTVNGGNVPSVNFGTDYTESTSANGGRGNIAIVINGAKDSLTTVTATHPGYIGKTEGKKFMAIINNAEGGNGAIDTTNAALMNKLDYKVKVTGGSATPVFSGTGENSTFLGITITDKDDEGRTILINGEVATPAGATADGVAYYTVPSTIGTTNITEITFETTGGGNPEPTITEKVVVDVKGDLTNGALSSDGKTIKKFSTITAAIDYLGAAGGTIHINGTFVPSTSSSEAFAATDTALERGEITFTGYSGQADKIDLSATNFHFVKSNFPMVFTNITIVGLPSSDSASNAGNLEKAVAGLKPITFGGNVKVEGKGIRLGGRWGAGPTNITTYSGTYSYVYAIGRSYDSGGVDQTVTYNFHGGTINNIYATAMSNSGSYTSYLKGDLTINTYEGVSIPYGIYLASRNGNESYISGNTIINVEGGNVPNVNFGTDYTSISSTSKGRGNIAIIINGAKESATTIKGTAPAVVGKTSGKKFIAIINNAEGGKGTIETSNAALMDKLDYKVSVTGGSATPVFSGSGENSTFLGIAVKDSANSGLSVLINGQTATPAGTQDGVSYYTVPSTLGTTNITAITFGGATGGEQPGGGEEPGGGEQPGGQPEVPTTKPDGPEKIVVDAKGNLTKWSVDADGYVIEKFATVREAIDYLNGAKGTIYINGTFVPTNSSTEAFSATNTATEREEITFEGYNGTADKIDLSATNFHFVQSKFSMVFKNITIITLPSSDSMSSGASLEKAVTGIRPITFGEKVVTEGKGLRLGGPFAPTGNLNKINVYSGTYSYVYAMGYQSGNSATNQSAEYNFYGGTVNNFYAAYISVGNKAPYLSGNFTVNVYGGNLGTMYLASRNDNWGYVSGVTTINIQGGSVSAVNFGTDYSPSNTTREGRGNIAIIINGAKETPTKITGTQPNLVGKSKSRRFMAIINNAEGGKGSIDLENQELLDLLDYKVLVTDGEAEPVYNGTGERALLLGFAIKQSNNKGGSVYIDGVLTAPQTSKDGVEYYVLPSTLGEKTCTSVTFGEPGEVPAPSNPSGGEGDNSGEGDKTPAPDETPDTESPDTGDTTPDAGDTDFSGDSQNPTPDIGDNSQNQNVDVPVVNDLSVGILITIVAGAILLLIIIFAGIFVILLLNGKIGGKN